MPIKTILQCPKCGSIITFEYVHSNIKECSSCSSVLVRENDELKVDTSLNACTTKGGYMQQGTTGYWNGKAFRILGKQGVWFEEAFFSYWFIVFSDGTTGLLAEGYGLYAILVKSQSSLITKDELDIKIGQTTRTIYQLQKKNSSYYWEAEGELQLPAISAYFDVFDLANENGDFLTVFQWANKDISIYESFPVSPDALQLKNTGEKHSFGIKLNCLHCSKSINVNTYPLAQSCTCDSCGIFYAIEKRALIKKKTSKGTHANQLLPIGTKGELKGIAYEVVGYTEKQEENSYKSRWREYVLFNIKYGFAFLSEFDGHWIYVRERLSCPVILNNNEKEFVFNKEPFQLYNSYQYKIIDAVGEFPYNTFDNGATVAKEYISPPEIWIREFDTKQGITWFFGEHITIKEITNAFSFDKPVPYKSGIGVVQPVNYINLRKLIFISFIGIAFLFIIHFLLVSRNENRVILEQTYFFNDSTDKVKVTLEKFNLDKWRSNLSFEVFAPVSNSWFELSASLVNTETGSEYSMEKGVEYYFGYTEGENWTEGSTRETGYITNVPAGNYILTLEGTREQKSTARLSDFSVKVIYDETSYRNFYYAILLFCIWPIINFFRSSALEKSRWENSPYSNYNTDEE